MKTISMLALMLLTTNLFAADVVKTAGQKFAGEPKVETLVELVTTKGSEKDLQDFTFINDLKPTICYLYVSPSYTRSWEEDILGSDTLGGRTRMDIGMNGYGQHCKFDVKAVQCNDDYATTTVNLCRVTNVYASDMF
ncbi:hypothetical protein A9Q84_20980 [Halobacteriovorax marinus]|uniref:Lipoprotein n=1 Tax=Halobacteriovorax marinus TaxID=97084 RepID=A0A1Y5F7W9_9BACT|nr:hypothetical protein A9Q84_20980 [Halobacteriovorax marinus]